MREEPEAPPGEMALQTVPEVPLDRAGVLLEDEGVQNASHLPSGIAQRALGSRRRGGGIRQSPEGRGRKDDFLASGER